MRQVALAAVLVLMAGGVQAATLNVIGGQLYGASGVDVGGTLYDVEFLDGACVDLFTGCDDLSDFTFTDHTSATLASQALLAQVFLDGVLGQFDSDAMLTAGCPPLSGNQIECRLLTPYLPALSPVTNFTFRAAVNRSQFLTSLVDVGGSGTLGASQPNSILDQNFPSAFARWSPVPEPGTALLLGLGLTGLSWSGGRRNRS
jgi:hypothetical protein